MFCEYNFVLQIGLISYEANDLREDCDLDLPDHEICEITGIHNWIQHDRVYKDFFRWLVFATFFLLISHILLQIFKLILVLDFYSGLLKLR